MDKAFFKLLKSLLMIFLFGILGGSSFGSLSWAMDVKEGNTQTPIKQTNPFETLDGIENFLRRQKGEYLPPQEIDDIKEDTKRALREFLEKPDVYKDSFPYLVHCSGLLGLQPYDSDDGFSNKCTFTPLECASILDFWCKTFKDIQELYTENKKTKKISFLLDHYPTTARWLQIIGTVDITDLEFAPLINKFLKYFDTLPEKDFFQWGLPWWRDLDENT